MFQVFNSFMTYHRVCGAYPSQQLSSIVFILLLVELVLFMLTRVYMSSSFGSVLWCPLRFPPKTDTRFMCRCFVGVLVLIKSIVCIYVCWCPTQFVYHMMFVSFNSNTTGATGGAGTANPWEAHEFTPAFSEVRVSRSSVFCIMFCKSLFVLFLFGHSIVCPAS